MHVQLQAESDHTEHNQHTAGIWEHNRHADCKAKNMGYKYESLNN